MMSNLFWQTDEQMARLQPFFPKCHGKPRVDDQRVLSGIIFINRNGLQWCDAPGRWGDESKRAFDAMMDMTKIDVALIEAALSCDGYFQHQPRQSAR